MGIHGWILTGLLFLLQFCLHSSRAVLVNVTVDDTNGDPMTGAQVSYTPSNVWNIGQDCDGCTAHPDPSQVFMGTWHDATFTPPSDSDPSESFVSLSFPFNGSAIYVFCILTFTLDFPAGNSDMQFSIDDDIVGSFELPANGSAIFDYNFPVYVNESINAGPHTFTLETGHADVKSVVLFDYLIYSYDDGASNSSSRGNGRHHNSTSQSPGHSFDFGENRHKLAKKFIIIIAVVVTLVGLIVVAGAVVLFLFLRQRRRRQKAKASLEKPESPIATSATALFPQVGPGERWLARRSQEEALPRLFIEHPYAGSSSPPQSTTLVEQQPPWLTRDPYPTTLPNTGRTSQPSTPTSGGSAPSTHVPTRNATTKSQTSPSPVGTSSPDAASMYFPPTSPYLTDGNYLTRTNTQATYGTIASSIAPYSDSYAPEQDDGSDADRRPMSLITERSEPTSTTARVGSLPPSYLDSLWQSEKS